MRQYKKKETKEKRKIVLDHYGNKCACCGDTHEEFLCIDHIDGKGAEHRREIGRQSIYRWLIKNNFPDGFRLLCWNCNASLAYYGYCPHQLEIGGNNNVSQ
jgi:hypothetical protein